MISEQEAAEFNAQVHRHRAERARLEARAAAGDVDFVWAELTRPRPAAADPGDLFPLLLKAIEARARLSPERFSAEILAKVISLTSYMALRSHYLLATRIEQFDRSPQGRGRVELTPPFTERVIPQLAALHESLAQVLHTQAAVARAWELARGKKLENDRAGEKPPAKATPKGKAKGKAKAGRKPRPPANGNGKSHADGTPNVNGTPGVNRIAGLLDNIESKANGVHHDD